MSLLYRSIVVSVCMLIYHATLTAQTINNSIHGKVLDEAGHPLMGAIISLPDLHTGTATDGKGDYTITHLPSGKYLLQVRMIGYAVITQPVDISGSKEYNFEMKESVVEANEVVITGTSVATEERKSVTPIQSIRVKEMQENAYTNVVDAIAKLPGVSQLSTGPAVSKPVIRGLGYNRIVTISDGVRQEGQQWGDEHGIEIDDYNVSKVEVLKGPASLAYGSDALAGVINIVTDEPLPVGKVKGTLTTNYQTNSGLYALNGNVSGNMNGVSWGIYATGKQSHDYHNRYDGYVYNSRFSNMDYGASIGVNRKWGYSKLTYSLFDQVLGISDGERDSLTGKFIKLVNTDNTAEEAIVEKADGLSYKKQVPSQNITHKKLVWNNNFYLKNSGRLSLIFGYQVNTRKEFENVLAPEDPGLWFLLKTYTYDAKYILPSIKGWQLSAGVNGMYQHNANKGNEYLIPDYKMNDAGVYIMGKRDWTKWSVSGGVRYNYRIVEGKGLYVDSLDNTYTAPSNNTYTRFGTFTNKYSNVVGSIGSSYAMSKRVVLKLNIASGYRSPNIAELSANGVHEGTIRYEYGNTGLKAENSLQGDAAVAINSEHILVNAALFYNYMSNYIYLQKLQSVSGADSIPTENNKEGYTAFAYRQTNAGLYGGELYADLHPHPLDWLHLENTLSYVRGVIFNGTDSTRNVPNIPALRWNIELRANSRKIGTAIRNAYAKVGVETYARQAFVYSAYNTETTTPGYSLLNAGIGFDIVSRKQKLICIVHLSGQNLTDKAYQNHLSRLKYAPDNYATGRTGIYAMGRNFSIGLSLPLDFK